jgi:hypothetical protein
MSLLTSIAVISGHPTLLGGQIVLTFLSIAGSSRPNPSAILSALASESITLLRHIYKVICAVAVKFLPSALKV